MARARETQTPQQGADVVIRFARPPRASRRAHRGAVAAAVVVGAHVEGRRGVAVVDGGCTIFQLLKLVGLAEIGWWEIRIQTRKFLSRIFEMSVLSRFAVVDGCRRVLQLLQLVGLTGDLN